MKIGIQRERERDPNDFSFSGQHKFIIRMGGGVPGGLDRRTGGVSLRESSAPSHLQSSGGAPLRLLLQSMWIFEIPKSDPGAWFSFDCLPSRPPPLMCPPRIARPQVAPPSALPHMLSSSLILRSQDSLMFGLLLLRPRTLVGE